MHLLNGHPSTNPKHVAQNGWLLRIATSAANHCASPKFATSLEQTIHWTTGFLPNDYGEMVLQLFPAFARIYKQERTRSHINNRPSPPFQRKGGSRWRGRSLASPIHLIGPIVEGRVRPIALTTPVPLFLLGVNLSHSFLHVARDGRQRLGELDKGCSPLHITSCQSAALFRKGFPYMLKSLPIRHDHEFVGSHV